MNDDIPIPIREATLRWTWRRRIAISSFVTITIVLLGLATGWFDITGENVTLTRVIIDGMFMIILAWIGGAIADDLGQKYLDHKHEKKDSPPSKPAG